MDLEWSVPGTRILGKDTQGGEQCSRVALCCLGRRMQADSARLCSKLTELPVEAYSTEVRTAGLTC